LSLLLYGYSSIHQFVAIKVGELGLSGRVYSVAVATGRDRLTLKITTRRCELKIYLAAPIKQIVLFTIASRLSCILGDVVVRDA
jgi:hypothetical protein